MFLKQKYGRLSTAAFSNQTIACSNQTIPDMAAYRARHPRLTVLDTPTLIDAIIPSFGIAEYAE